MTEREEKWHRRYLELAKYISQWSRDPSTKVGSVVVDYSLFSAGRVVGVGYNGFSEGVEDTPERLSDRPTKYSLVTHAEVNACTSAGDKARGSTLYVYPSFDVPPICNECCKVAKALGIKRVIGYISDESDERKARWKDSITVSRTICNESGIEYFGLKE